MRRGRRSPAGGSTPVRMGASCSRALAARSATTSTGQRALCSLEPPPGLLTGRARPGSSGRAARPRAKRASLPARAEQPITGCIRRTGPRCLSRNRAHVRPNASAGLRHLWAPVRRVAAARARRTARTACWVRRWWLANRARPLRATPPVTSWMTTATDRSTMTPTAVVPGASWGMRAASATARWNLLATDVRPLPLALLPRRRLHRGIGLHR